MATILCQDCHDSHRRYADDEEFIDPSERPKLPECKHRTTCMFVWMTAKETHEYRSKARIRWYYLHAWRLLPVGFYDVYTEGGTLVDRFRVWGSTVSR